MEYKLGKPKDLDSITVQDVLSDKVWIWTWEAGLEGDFDEDWQVPVKDVNDIKDQFIEPTITLKIIGSDLIASGTYDHEQDRIYGIAVWENEDWQLLKNVSLIEPITFESMVKINGQENTKFILISKDSDEAFKKK